MTQNKKNVDENEELNKQFKLFDRDGNSFVSVTELKYVMKNLDENMTDDEIKMIMNLDTDDDGLINFDEFNKINKSPQIVGSRIVTACIKNFRKNL